MNNFLHHPCIKVLSCYLVLFLAGLIPAPQNAWASFIYHQSEKINELDAESLEILQIALENEIIEEKLSELGLSPEEVIDRVGQLRPDERKACLEELRTLQVGGDAGGTALGFLVVFLILVYFIMDTYAFIKDISSWFPKYKPGEKKHKNNSQFLSYFPTANGVDLVPYEEEVRVLVNEEPNENSILVGEIRIKEKLEKEQLLMKMKELAGKHGADTIWLPAEEPAGDTWSARAYRTKLEIEQIDDGINKENID